MVAGIPKQFEDQFWARHSNPKSGWMRVPSGAVIVYAIYHRNWRLLGAALIWTAINPFLFSPPETEDAWMTRVVLAERWWVKEKTNRTVGLGYPNVCNAVAALGFVYALYAAWRHSPKGAILGVVTSIALKLWWARVLVKRYDQRTG
ncbi:DUF6653 family protein [Halalkalicoccus ordinarius]|uniref:DUF6653 family protein n=1 Tax=Halalkalicoccus ordinarius TaxID=3116651 RepID=UPI00300F17B0